MLVPTHFLYRIFYSVWRFNFTVPRSFPFTLDDRNNFETEPMTSPNDVGIDVERSMWNEISAVDQYASTVWSPSTRTGVWISSETEHGFYQSVRSEKLLLAQQHSAPPKQASYILCISLLQPVRKWRCRPHCKPMSEPGKQQRCGHLFGRLSSDAILWGRRNAHSEKKVALNDRQQ